MLWPAFAWHEKSSTEKVQERYVDSKVFVDRLVFGFIVPMIKLRLGKDILQPAKPKAEIGMDEYQMQRYTTKAAGVEDSHVEQDQSRDTLASIKQSIGYLNKM